MPTTCGMRPAADLARGRHWNIFGPTRIFATTMTLPYHQTSCGTFADNRPRTLRSLKYPSPICNFGRFLPRKHRLVHLLS
jgi:hypothetical protein